MARKLKRYVVPSVLGILGVGLLVGTPIYMKETKPVKSNYRYTIKEDSNIDNVFPVLSEAEENKPLRPFLEETVGKTKDYYNMKDGDSKTGTLKILEHFKTVQQATEWTCGTASALMNIEWFGKNEVRKGDDPGAGAKETDSAHDLSAHSHRISGMKNLKDILICKHDQARAHAHQHIGSEPCRSVLHASLESYDTTEQNSHSDPDRN